MAIPPSYSDPAVLAQIQGLALRAKQVVEGTLSGMHRSPFRGSNVEFAEYREYSPGDDLRRLDWRILGRTDRYFIKQYEAESTLRCAFVVDSSGSMQYGSQPLNKYDYAATFVASLATLLLRQQDAVGVMVCDDQSRQSLQPVATQAQLQRLVELLEATRPQGKTALGSALHQLNQQLPQRGMVVIVSDLFTDTATWFDALAQLRFRGHDVLVFQVLDRAELEFPFDDPVLLQDMEGGGTLYAEPWTLREAYQDAVQQFTHQMRDACHRQRADYALISTDEPIAKSLSEFLHLRNKRH